MSQPSKIFKSHGEQIDLLRSRGMRIEDEAEARRILERVNYYRLAVAPKLGVSWHIARQCAQQAQHEEGQVAEPGSHESDS
ncbi:hypothetical protein QP888_03695 [Corynebacterium sp. MSK297]|uniref:hypothetical protein n=1 Tax=Corynebacterium sp. MSK297 TaxID=3050221 RepID=UPI00254DDF9E|nr:hypothetical protein [Corynebacterium sp. MSK297]MDK8845628.1 hypothetical protein [Corynebacterium sp. MSK297]